MTVQRAVDNITEIVSNTKMTRQEHGQLIQDIALVVQRCKLADELEKLKLANEKELKKKAKKEKTNGSNT